MSATPINNAPARGRRASRSRWARKQHLADINVAAAARCCAAFAHGIRRARAHAVDNVA